MTVMEKVIEERQFIYMETGERPEKVLLGILEWHKLALECCALNQMPIGDHYYFYGMEVKVGSQPGISFELTLSQAEELTRIRKKREEMKG